MEWFQWIPIIVSGLGVLWSIFRDKTKDYQAAEARIVDLEQKVLVQENVLETLKNDQQDYKELIKQLDTRVQDLDRSITRLTTILEMMEKKKEA
ncbi:hypothetical protein [Cedecea lapagei]|uniref:hypothetical protein n=1 Tax=Cedecea lapagei TaxID=158823 RepID=UPI001BCBB28F|nr:hypothetical protein [Cedecea lapagei]